jgi:hypothetical protein
VVWCLELARARGFERNYGILLTTREPRIGPTNIRNPLLICLRRVP